MIAFGLERGGIPVALAHQVVYLEANLDAERLAEGIVGLDLAALAQQALHIDVGLAEGFPSYGNLAVLEGMPEEASPVAAIGVERSAEIEDISFHHG